MVIGVIVAILVIGFFMFSGGANKITLSFDNLEPLDNALFKRKEIQVDLDAETVPKNLEVAQLLADKFSVPLENVALINILGKFGSKTFNIRANIYESKEALLATEPKHNRPTPTEIPTEPSAEAPAAEPVEEKKEEAKPEVKEKTE